jgi:hypothetical protein
VEESPTLSMTPPTAIQSNIMVVPEWCSLKFNSVYARK